MAIFISEKDVSPAWAAAFDALVTRGGDVVDLTVAIADPTAEHGHEQVEALPDDCEAALRMSP